MKKNIGLTDKLIRIFLAALIAVLYLTHIITGTFAVVLLVVGIILVATSLFSFCGLYAIFGMNTCKLKK